MKTGTLDVPNQRSSHSAPTPRGGGLSIIIGTIVGNVLLIYSQIAVSWIFIICALALGFIGWLDDSKRVNGPFVRLALQLIIVLCFVWNAPELALFPLPEPLDIKLGITSSVFAALWILSYMNMFNFMDGLDGLATSQAVCIALLWSLYVGWYEASMMLVIGGACFGFLILNWSPAKIFMGDSGSMFLGFSLSALPFITQEKPVHESILVMALLSWVFLSDASFTLCRRLLRQERVWQAHRSHLYQRLNQQGWSHAKVTGLVITLGLAISLASLYLVSKSRWVALLWAALVFVAYATFITYKEHSSSKAEN